MLPCCCRRVSGVWILWPEVIPGSTGYVAKSCIKQRNAIQIRDWIALFCLRAHGKPWPASRQSRFRTLQGTAIFGSSCEIGLVWVVIPCTGARDPWKRVQVRTTCEEPVRDGHVRVVRLPMNSLTNRSWILGISNRPPHDDTFFSL